MRGFGELYDELWEDLANYVVRCGKICRVMLRVVGRFGKLCGELWEDLVNYAVSCGKIW